MKLKPEAEILNYLLGEDKENYKRALMNYSSGYGIGSFAYYRRIIENEIKRFINDIANLDFEGADKVQEAISKYEKDKQMSNLIDELSKYIPSSLNRLSENPIKLLYSQLSGGIHYFSEEECLRKSESIDVVLKYVIRALNEEKNEVKKVKEALKNLKGQ